MNPKTIHRTIRISVGLALIIGFIGCATPSPRYTDAELALAMRQTEAATLARLQHSYSDDIAAAARALAAPPPHRDR